MSRDKQISEMAKDICRVEERCIVGCQPTPKCRAHKYAERAYNAGYRKSSEVAEEIFAEIDDFQRTLRHIFLDMCGGNDYNTLNLLQIDSAIEALFDSRIAELKKKYSGKDTNVTANTEGGEWKI